MSTHHHEPAISRPCDGKKQARDWDREMGGLAGRQFGVVSRGQLLALGLGEAAIDSRLQRGRLHRLHSGVYAVGHRVIPREGRWLAAVLASGTGAVLSHRSAAALWGLMRTRDGRIEITTARPLRSSPTIWRHEVPLPRDEVTTRSGIPVTTLSRTLFDVAAGVSAEGFEGAIREAEYRHRFQAEDLRSLLSRHPGKRGARTLRTCLDRLDCGPRGRTRSMLETRFAALVARASLPQPRLNVLLDIDGVKVEADCLWRDQRVIVELDGSLAHRTRVAFEADRERDRRLQATGWRVVRVTWRQLDNPTPLLKDLRQLLQVEPVISGPYGGKSQARRHYART